jgi:hypothetical protein
MHNSELRLAVMAGCCKGSQPVLQSKFIKNFSISSADEILSAYCSATAEIVLSYAQQAMKSFPRWLSSMHLDAYINTVKI